MSFLNCGAHSWTQYYRCGLISAMGKGHLLWPTGNTPNAAQEAVGLLCCEEQCWLMFTLTSSRTPRTFATKLFSNLLIPSLYCCMGLFLPRCRDLHFALLKCAIINSYGKWCICSISIHRSNYCYIECWWMNWSNLTGCYFYGMFTALNSNQA